MLLRSSSCSALVSRLLPHVLEVAESLGSGPRLRYPLGYWNANGAICGIAVAMLLWLSRRARWSALRWLSVAAMPAVLLTLYFTYSRGGLLALVVGAVCMIALSRDRLWLLATLAIAGARGAARRARRAGDDSLADNLANQAAVDQGVTVLLILLAGIALALAALRRRCAGSSARRAATGRAVGLSRDPTVLQAGSPRGPLVASAPRSRSAAAPGTSSRAPTSSSPADPAQHFSDFSGAGRHDFWRVAIDAFEEKPLLGHGAGTYEFSWERAALDRPAASTTPTRSTSRRSPSWAWSAACSSSAWSARCSGSASPPGAPPRTRERERYAALFAAMLAFAVGAAFDWFWEIAGAGRRLLPRRRRPGRGALRAARRRPRRRRAQAEGGASASPSAAWPLAWIAAIALVGPLLVEREIDASQRAAADGRHHQRHRPRRARPARSSPGPPPPTCSSACSPSAQGEYPTAVERLQPGDRPRGSQLGAVLPALASRGRGRRTKPPPAPTSERRAN